MVSNIKDNNEYIGFSRFKDGFKFKYDSNGEVCLSTDCSTWAKRVLNNMPLFDFIDSKQYIPPSEFLTFPEFGTLKQKKRRRESIDNYIEDCEFCGNYMEKSFKVGEKLICEHCNLFLKTETCSLCKNLNIYHNMFLDYYDKNSVSFQTTLINNNNMTVDSNIFFYCKTCNDNLSLYQYDTEFDLEACPGCGVEDSAGSLCYMCRYEGRF